MDDVDLLVTLDAGGLLFERGDTITLDIEVTVRPDAHVSVLGFTLDFDASVLRVEDIAFGNALDVLGNGSATAVDMGTAGSLSLVEVSLDPPADLATLQPDNFTFATVTLEAVGSGASVLSGEISTAADAFANPLTADGATARITVTDDTLEDPGTGEDVDVLKATEDIDLFIEGLSEITGLPGEELVVLGEQLSDRNGDGLVGLGRNEAIDLSDGRIVDAPTEGIRANGLRFVTTDDGPGDLRVAYTSAGLSQGTADRLVDTIADLDATLVDLSAGATVIEGFSREDAIVLDNALRDGNGDGLIALGRNNALDLSGGENGTVLFADDDIDQVVLRLAGEFALPDGDRRYVYVSSSSSDAQADDALAQAVEALAPPRGAAPSEIASTALDDAFVDAAIALGATVVLPGIDVAEFL